MDKPKLTITPKKYGGESTVVSLRLARDLLRDIDKVAAATGRNRNELMTICLEFALNHMEIETKEEDT